MKTIIIFMRYLWLVLNRPSKHIALGAVICLSFIAGIIFLGGFHLAVESTNTEKFCISCHSMKENNYEEVQSTGHWINRSGVRATCPDCHVPHNWSDKMAAKVRASKDVFGWILGTIDTKEKFESKRLEMAEHEWARFKANGSLECRNCHDYKSMDFEKMSARGQIQMRKAAKRDQSCLDCHKGIAHQLPEMTHVGNTALAKMARDLNGNSYDVGMIYHTLIPTFIYSNSNESHNIGTLNTATAFKVLGKTKTRLHVELAGWRKVKGYGRIMYFDFAKNIVLATLDKATSKSDSMSVRGERKIDELTGLTWEKISYKVWIDKGGFEPELQNIWDYAGETYLSTCSVCHTQPDENHFDTNTWPGMFAGMKGFINLDEDTSELVLKYLQHHSSDYSSFSH